MEFLMISFNSMMFDCCVGVFFLERKVEDDGKHIKTTRKHVCTGVWMLAQVIQRETDGPDIDP